MGKRGGGVGRLLVVGLVLTLPAFVGIGARVGASPPDNVLHIGTLNVDPPTLLTLGVQQLISGDDNRNATIGVRYRAMGSSTWRAALPLFRVHPENSVRPVPEQFAGSIFDLAPATSYDIELHAVDPDGPVDQTIATTATTRGVPSSDPQHPHPVAATNAASLQAALDAAQPGDVINLANGSYNGAFTMDASGTAVDPIVIRGASEDGAIVDGGGCSSCNVLEVYGSFVHVERLTLRHANRAIRFHGESTQADVLRRVHIRDVRLGVGSEPDQRDFYVCDNIIEGRLVWPAVYAGDRGRHSGDDGINLSGDGHVVCHNQISGFGDAMKFGDPGARAGDFYGNEVNSSYDNAIEFDGSEGNVRAFRNRFTNTYAPISFQPVYGGPAYAIHNVVVNVADEQLKFHANNPPLEEPDGVLVYQNTFVSPEHALHMSTEDTSHHFTIENNLFVGPASPPGHVVDWSAPIDDGTFDYNGWYPDGFFDFNHVGKWTSFAAMQAAGPFEAHGRVLSPPTFASGLVAPSSYKPLMEPPDVTLATGTNARDAALVLPNVNDGYQGPAPDLGALERGCPIPIYGVRPAGIDETNEPYGCGGPTVAVPPLTTLIQTTAMKLSDPNPSARKFSFKATTKTDPAPERVIPPVAGSATDPVLAGATLTIYNAAGSGEKVVVVLPASRWSLGKKGFTFANPGGPISSVGLAADSITISGGGSQFDYALAAPSQRSIAVRLDIGSGASWCAAAPAKPSGRSGSTAASDHAKVFVAAAKTAAPSACPAVP